MRKTAITEPLRKAVVHLQDAITDLQKVIAGRDVETSEDRLHMASTGIYAAGHLVHDLLNSIRSAKGPPIAPTTTTALTRKE